jgi:hypothetical protein
MGGRGYSIDTSRGFKFKGLPDPNLPLVGDIKITLSDELKEIAKNFKLKKEEQKN